MNFTIFLSYCWANEKFANEIDNGFARVGFNLIRDIRQIEYKQSLKQFMKGIRKTDSVIMVISNDYLKSKNCMFEVLEVFKDVEYRDRIFPIVLPDTDIYDDMKSLQFYEYWSIKYSELEAKISKMPVCDIGEYGKELKIIRDIKSTINEFIALLRDWVIKPYDELSKGNFAALRSTMPIKDTTIVKVSKIGDALLEKTYQALRQMHKEINFYPIHLLQNTFPFRLSKRGYTYYSSYTLETDNDQLVKLFKMIEEGEQAYDESITTIEDYRGKILFIRKALVRNYVWYLSNKNREEVKIISPFKHDPNDIHHLCDSFQFKRCFEKLDINLDNHNELIKHGYVAYKLGDYLRSAQCQKKAYDIALKNNHYLGAFIAIYNLRNLDHLLYREEGKEGNELYKIANGIDIKEEAKKLTTKENEAVINWILDGMYSKSSESLLEMTRNITDHYYSFKKGGSSHNGHVHALVSRYLKFLAFVNLNYIIYEHYAEFNNINAIFFEGLIASHAITDKGGSNLDQFSNLMVMNLIDGGGRDKIMKYFRRYELDCIKYDYNSKEQYAIEAIKNFFTSTIELFEHPIQYNKRFWEKQNEILGNILTYTALADMPIELIEYICDNLLYILENKLPAKRLRCNNIMDFLNRQGKKIDSSYLLRLVAVFISDKKYVEDYDNVYVPLARAFQCKNESLQLNDEQYTLLERYIESYFDAINCRYSVDKFYELILCLEEGDKKVTLQKVIESGLIRKFEFETCYLAIIFSVIELKDALLDKMITSISSIKRSNDVNRISIFGHREDRSYAFGQFINLCFKEEINTKSNRFDFIRKFDVYYEWLLDIDTFDYSNFDPDWITEYGTKFYLKRFSESKVLKMELEKCLKKKVSSQVIEYYTKTYISEVWNKKP